MDERAWDLLVQGCEQARDQFFDSLGTNGQKINPIITYAFRGFPAWPVRDCWHIVQRPNSTLIFSDGLSDPYRDGRPSIGLEVVVETAHCLPDFNSVTSSWAYELVFQASFYIAGNPSLRSSLEEKRSATVEFQHVRAPSDYLTSRNTIGTLLTFGGHNIPERITLPENDARVLVVTPLLVKELADACGENRTDVIGMLLSELPRRGYHHFCHDSREPVS
ncbi:MAG TPA: hypothetical protein V6C97_23775 [Oculatellaceae cyanobacterium]